MISRRLPLPITGPGPTSVFTPVMDGASGTESSTTQWKDERQAWIPYPSKGEHVGRTPYDLDGALVGLQARLQHQSGSFVFGIEGDIAWSDISGNEDLADTRTEKADKTQTGSLGADINWLATLRARAGLTTWIARSSM